jgi:hypothetical protein
MITGEHDKLVEIARFNLCSIHHTHLEVAWYQKQWALRCGGGGGHYPDTVVRQLSLTEQHKAGEELPEPIKDNVKKRMRRRAMENNNTPVELKSLMLPNVDLGTGQALSVGLGKALVLYAEKYHLDPTRGHVVMMYGHPYITIDGYLYHARKSGINYSLESRPMTTKEKKDYRLEATDYGWIATLSFVDTGQVFTGLGIVSYAEMSQPSARDPNIPAHPVVAAHPQLLGQKRAEWQALRRAFPIGGE